MTPENVIRLIRPGTTVTINVPNGKSIDRATGRIVQDWKQARGRAVICNFVRNPDDLTVALNMGGRFGTPAVATVDNIVAAGRYKVIR